MTVYDEGEMSHIFVSGLSEHEKLISSQAGEDKQYRTADNQFVLTVKTNRVEKIETDPVKVIEKNRHYQWDPLRQLFNKWLNLISNNYRRCKAVMLFPHQTGRLWLWSLSIYNFLVTQ